MIHVAIPLWGDICLAPAGCRKGGQSTVWMYSIFRLLSAEAASHPIKSMTYAREFPDYYPKAWILCSFMHNRARMRALPATSRKEKRTQWICPRCARGSSHRTTPILCAVHSSRSFIPFRLKVIRYKVMRGIDSYIVWYCFIGICKMSWSCCYPGSFFYYWVFSI